MTKFLLREMKTQDQGWSRAMLLRRLCQNIFYKYPFNFKSDVLQYKLIFFGYEFMQNWRNSSISFRKLHTLNSRFLILRKKFKTNHIIRFCSHKFKLTVYITEKRVLILGFVLKFSRTIRNVSLNWEIWSNLEFRVSL